MAGDTEVSRPADNAGPGPADVPQIFHTHHLSRDTGAEKKPETSCPSFGISTTRRPLPKPLAQMPCATLPPIPKVVVYGCAAPGDMERYVVFVGYI